MVGQAIKLLDLIIAYCGENLSKLSALSRNNPDVFLNQVNLYIYNKCPFKETLIKSEMSPFFKSVKEIDVYENVVTSEFGAYYKHIIDSYDSSSDYTSCEYTIYLHGDFVKHIPDLSLLNNAIDYALSSEISNKVDVLHLSNLYLLSAAPDFDTGEYSWNINFLVFPQYQWIARKFHAKLLGLTAQGFLPEPCFYSFYCCTQFMVKNSLLKRRPKQFYARSLEFLDDPKTNGYGFDFNRSGVFEYDVKKKTGGEMAETVWHILIGDKPVIPSRNMDDRLPEQLRKDIKLT
jgi:Protein of unknown function (DUF3431)